MVNTFSWRDERRPLRWLPFDEWVAHVFNHPAEEEPWYFGEDYPIWDAPASVTLSHLTRLFRNPIEPLEEYDDQQVEQGFWYISIGDWGESRNISAILDTSVPLETRIWCVDSIVTLFAKLFAVRCSEHLSHVKLGAGEPINPLNGACYMWWDLVSDVFDGFAVADDPSLVEVNEAVISVMERTLSMDSLACRESALHGLGHWRQRCPGRVTEIIDSALSRRNGWPTELIQYARQARNGPVQ